MKGKRKQKKVVKSVEEFNQKYFPMDDLLRRVAELETQVFILRMQRINPYLPIYPSPIWYSTDTTIK
jgi:hypothetical protein